MQQFFAAQVANGILASGATAISFLCFASGHRTAMSHAMATDKVVAAGEIIRFDVGGAYGFSLAELREVVAAWGGWQGREASQTAAGVKRDAQAITAERAVKVAVPAGSRFKGYEALRLGRWTRPDLNTRLLHYCS